MFLITLIKCSYLQLCSFKTKITTSLLIRPVYQTPNRPPKNRHTLQRKKAKVHVVRLVHFASLKLSDPQVQAVVALGVRGTPGVDVDGVAPGAGAFSGAGTGAGGGGATMEAI